MPDAIEDTRDGVTFSEPVQVGPVGGGSLFVGIDPDNYQKWLEGYGGYYAPAYSGTMKQPYWQDPIRKVFMENAKYGHGIGWPGPLTVAAREAYANFFVTEMVQMVVVQGKTPEAAVKETAPRLKEIYSRY